MAEGLRPLPVEDLSRTTEVILVRHGLPVTAVAMDPPLSSVGRAQAGRAGSWLRWDAPAAVVASPYLRARETAEIIAAAAGLVVTIDEDLREWSAPPRNHYVTPEMLAGTDRGRAYAEGRFADFIPEHDTVELATRMTAAVTRAAACWAGRTVVLVSHGGAINNLLAAVLGASATFFFDPGYTSICRLRAMSSGRLVLASVNETGHLVGARTAGTPSTSADDTVDEGARL
jgi:2,3-bisphosphoglycerate-dependent phosphoglycerate mutase